MTALAAARLGKEIAFSDEEFSRLAHLAHSEFGITLTTAKKPLVYSRLTKRLTACDLADFSSYITFVENTQNAEERSELVSALTTNVTSFFREAHHFDTVKSVLLPRLKSVPEKRRIRFWSAGCSSGPEPYSLAMTVLDAWPELAQRDFKILATDIDQKIVSTAREGVYDEDVAKSIPTDKRKKWTAPDAARPDHASMKPELRRHIHFGELNLVKAWPMSGPFDAIFCRNVAIYFETATQQVLWKRFTDLLAPGGFLFIGHSERVSGPALDDLQVAGVTTYQKTESPGDKKGSPA